MATYVASPRFVVDAIFGLTHTTQNLLAPLSNTRYGAEVLGIPNTNLGPLPTAGCAPPLAFSTGSLHRVSVGFSFHYFCVHHVTHTTPPTLSTAYPIRTQR